LKVLYYITDHGLGHASRSVALIRELESRAEVVVRHNDPYSFVQRSLPNTRIIRGQTDFLPVMNPQNRMLIDDEKTQTNILGWIDSMSEIVESELDVIRKQKPDLIVSDISIMPLLAAKKSATRCAAISNFTWSETLKLDKESRIFFDSAYSDADLVVRLPMGTKMPYINRKDVGLVARKITTGRQEIRKQLGVGEDTELVLIAVSGADKLSLHSNSDIKIIDISDYDTIMKLKSMINFVEGQNLIAASDLVICKCGYGFVSECLATETKFRYIVETAHLESNEIHNFLQSKGLSNRVYVDELAKISIDTQFLDESQALRVDLDNDNVANQLLAII
jgi:hypothetical protein